MSALSNSYVGSTSVLPGIGIFVGGRGGGGGSLGECTDLGGRHKKVTFHQRHNLKIFFFLKLQGGHIISNFFQNTIAWNTTVGGNN